MSAAALVYGALRLCASDAETIGLAALRRERPSLTGAGIHLGQSEGREATNAWQVNPMINPLARFTWSSDQGTTTNFPNSVGLESTHANTVGRIWYSFSEGIAPAVPSVDNYDADHFFDAIIMGKQSIPAQVVNQSWIIDTIPSTTIDPFYDEYAMIYNVLFVSGMNNEPDTSYAPGTAYNGIGVGFIAPVGQSSIGPTMDGRAKPDIVAPQYFTSFSTPLVAGGATLLLQAAAANDGGAGTASLATNSATIKALLLNGALKTTNWTNGVTRPLDARYGAGVLNIYNSDLQLRGGRRAAVATNNVISNTPHPPSSHTNNVTSLRGWDFSSIQSSPVNDRVAHYYFDLPMANEAYSATATLVWKKSDGPLANLDLFLFETTSGTLVTQSTSGLDNVQHIFIPSLPAGRYDLQVLKRGGPLQAGNENYALAFDFSPAKLTSTRSDGNLVVAWPASPAGFTLQSASSLTAPAWHDVPVQPILSNALNTVTLPASAPMQFFRLFRP